MDAYFPQENYYGQWPLDSKKEILGLGCLGSMGRGRKGQVAKRPLDLSRDSEEVGKSKSERFLSGPLNCVCKGRIGMEVFSTSAGAWPIYQYFDFFRNSVFLYGNFAQIQ